MGCNRFRQAQRATRPQRQRWLPIVVVLTCAWTGTSSAQSPPRVHYLHHEFMPPGAIGQEQLRRHAGMAGYFQAVELIPPEGARISVMQNGAFQETAAGSVLAGMQLGYVYSLKVTRLAQSRRGRDISDHRTGQPSLSTGRSQERDFRFRLRSAEEDIASSSQRTLHHARGVLGGLGPGISARTTRTGNDRLTCHQAKTRCMLQIVWGGQWRFCESVRASQMKLS